MSVVAIVDPIKGLIGLDKHKIDNFVFRLDLTFPSDEAVASRLKRGLSLCYLIRVMASIHQHASILASVVAQES